MWLSLCYLLVILEDKERNAIAPLISKRMLEMLNLTPFLRVKKITETIHLTKELILIFVNDNSFGLISSSKDSSEAMVVCE